MYECCKCKIEISLLREAVIHQTLCATKWSDMVYTRFRVPAYMQYKRQRHVRGIKREKSCLKNLLQITKL